MKNLSKIAALAMSWAVSMLMPSVSAQAQQEARNWYFGNQAAVSFGTGQPTAMANSSMVSYEGCASISKPNGELAMYTNGERIWDANHQVMPNGSSLGGHNSASQSALLLRAPGSSSLYYVFTVDAIDNNLVGGLRYSVVDLSLRGGLGDVLPTSKNLRLPTPTLTGKVTEKLTAALHANGRDYWVVVHGWQNNQFYSFLLSPSGVSSVPVVSSVGPVHQGGGSFFGAGNAVGCMRVSPNGAKLALAQRDTGFELYDFNNVIGTVSNAMQLVGTRSFNYGVEFSPDNSRLYVTNYSDGGSDTQICQFTLSALNPSTIQNSRTVVGSVNGLTVAIQSGFDGKIYLSSYNSSSLSTIETPNALGSNCQFRANTILLSQKLGQNGLPNFPNAFGSLPTAVVKGLNAQLKVVPNPAHGRVSVTVPLELRHKPLVMTLVSVAGHAVLTKTISGSETEEEVLLAGVAKGVYLLRLTGSEAVLTKRIIVE